uniref:Uncharacterized protein n=1 Tax=Glossina palpalis gambiensis TaxID=67801 RepID=A0A1B0C4A3_9MUSC
MTHKWNRLAMTSMKEKFHFKKKEKRPFYCDITKFINSLESVERRTTQGLPRSNFGITWHYKRFNVASRKRIQQICHTDVGSFIVPTKIIHNATLLVAVGNHQQHRH